MIAKFLTTVSGKRICFSFFLLVSPMFFGVPLGAAPIHRYSFTADAGDSIGSADGTLLGNAMITNGCLLLNGTNGYVQLPSYLFTNSTSLTLEAWFQNNQFGIARHLWLLGGSSVNYMLWYPGGFSVGYYGSQAANTRVQSVPISAGIPHHLVWVQDGATHTASVFLDGHLYGQNTNFTATAGTGSGSGFLGGGAVSAPIKGSITEFRIYTNALSHLDILRSEALGADAVPADGDTITNLWLHAPSYVGLNSLTRPPVFADFASRSMVDVTPLTQIVFSSSDTNVMAPNTNGYISAVGLGAANLIATYGGFSATSMVTVVSADQFALAHRYDFHGVLGSTNLPDLAGNASGTLINGGIFTNVAQLYFDGYNDYVDLPDGMLSSLNEVTMEAWVTGFALNGKFWPRVFDFGSGSSYFFLAPSVQNDNLSANTQLIRFAVSTNGILKESPRLTAKPWMQDGFETHLAITYCPTRNVSKLYVNGMLMDSGPAPYPLSMITDTNNWLGRSQFSGDAYFQGVFDEFRIYRTVLEPSQIAASYALGPDVIGADYVLRPRLTETNLVLSWGPSASWCVLQTTSALTPGNTWTNAAITPTFTDGHFEATIPLSSSIQFFRLSPQ